MKVKIIITIAILLLTGYVQGQSKQVPAIKKTTPVVKKKQVELAVGMKAPVLKAEEWFSEKPDIKGKFVALDFWGPSCKPCIAGFAHVNELHQKYKDKIAFIATTTDNPEAIYVYDGPPIEFYSMILKSWDEYFITGIPHMIIVDPKGIVRFSGNGYDLTEEKLNDIFIKYSN